MRKRNLMVIVIFLSLVILGSCKKETEETLCAESTWYKDADNDGLGDKNVSFASCQQPFGYVANADDTDDNVSAKGFIPEKGYSSPESYPNRTLVWADEFSGTSLNEDNWNYEMGDGCPGNCGWGNNELQYYKKENTTVKDGYLVIEAKKEAVNGKQYSSSRLTTQNKVIQKFGRIDIRAALPKGQGIWPALWMLGKNINEVSWPKCGEIDIMEMVGGQGKDNTVHGTVHWDNNNSHAEYGGKTELVKGIFSDEFHVFSIEWDEKKIVWYLDDVQYHVIDITPAGLSELSEEFFFIFNVAVGGNWPGSPDGTTIFPQRMVVDYIRVFK